MSTSLGKVTQFKNCSLLRNHSIVKEDLWIRSGKIINPEVLYFIEKVAADEVVDCHGALIAPGFIDLQINGGFGYDFSDHDSNFNILDAINAVSKGILEHGVTAYCPTLITQSEESYSKLLPNIKRRRGSKESGAAVLGAHLEGPFISLAKKGAHPTEQVKSSAIESFGVVQKVYGNLEDVSIITVAPELDVSGCVITELTSKGIVVSLGHSEANLAQSEAGVKSGANFITHLFNAMLPFHHRDPGLIGLLTSDDLDKPIFFGIIADGIHTHYTALRIAFRAHPQGLVLVTDAISAMGLSSGVYTIGSQSIEIFGNKAVLAGTNTLCGSIATMDECVRLLKSFTGCSVVEALECATLHPAQVLGISDHKGSLHFGADADFIFLNENLQVIETFIDGISVWKRTELK